MVPCAMEFRLTQEQYEALIALAREGVKVVGEDGLLRVDQDSAIRLDGFLRSIEASNDVVRDAVWIQWQELRQPVPPAAAFPESWPPQQRAYLEFVSQRDSGTGSVRRVSKADVLERLRTDASSPTNVLVTRDPGARNGWTELDKFFK